MKILQILVLILGLTILGNAQKAILSGTIYDASGAVIPQAKVTAINTFGEKFETETNENGEYVLNLPYNRIQKKNAGITKFEIIIDLTSRGFEKFNFKNFKFVPAFKGRMNFDIALDSLDPEPCGYGGSDCLVREPIITENSGNKVSEKFYKNLCSSYQRKKNKNKRKNKNN